MLSTNRGIIKYILLTIITFGIYAFWYQYKIAQDINTICEGDGKKTAGLLKFLLLTIVTFFIYMYVWYFCTANRLADNAERYGVKVFGNGKIVLLLRLFALVFWPCNLIAEYIIMHNTNVLADAYNKQQLGIKLPGVAEYSNETEKELEGECKWFIGLAVALTLVSTRIKFTLPLFGNSLKGVVLSAISTLGSEWEKNWGLCLLACGIIGMFYLGIMLYVISAALLLLRRRQNVGTYAIIGYYCNLFSAIGFLALDYAIFEYISLFYLILFSVLNIVAVMVLAKNNDVS